MAGTTGWVEECHPERWNGAEDRTGAGQDRQWASQWTVPGWREVAGVCPPQGPHCPIFSHLLPSRISLSPFFTFQLSLRSIPTRSWTDRGEGRTTVSHPGNKHAFRSLKSKQEQVVAVCLMYHLIHPHISQDATCLPSLCLFLR